MANQQYSNLLTKVIREKNVTFQELESKMHIPQKTLRRYASGETKLSVDILDCFLEALDVELSEFSFLLNQFQHDYKDVLFAKIEDAYLLEDTNKLDAIMEEVARYPEQRMIYLDAKGALTMLSEEEQVEVNTFLVTRELWTFFELEVMRATIKHLSTPTLRTLLQYLRKRRQNFTELHRYRRIVEEICCRAVNELIFRDEQKTAIETLDFAAEELRERDTFVGELVKFTLGHFNYCYSLRASSAEGDQAMQEVVDYLTEKGARKYASFYGRMYQRVIDETRKYW